MTTESTPGALGSNDQLGLTEPERAAFSRVPRGWRIEAHEPSRTITVVAPNGDGCVVAQCPTGAREIPEAMLYSLADALLEVAVPRPCEQLGMALVDSIADEGCRNAVGGIYATRVQEFAMEVQRAFAQQNGLMVRGLTDASTTPLPDFPSGGIGCGGLTQCDMHEDESH